jgi:hypothetical protein
MLVLNTTDLAAHYGITPAAVTNLRRRHPDFPPPVPSVHNGVHFDAVAVGLWLVARAADRVHSADMTAQAAMGRFDRAVDDHLAVEVRLSAAVALDIP